MTQTLIQQSFAPFKKYLPSKIHNVIRAIGAVVIGPVLFAHRTGYARSALKMSAVSREGKPLPWYTYPAIDFLSHRNYEDATVLEFGGGQSTLWWAERASRVVTLEGDRQWYDKIKMGMPSNVDLHYVSMDSKDENIAQVNGVLSEGVEPEQYDVIVIDGLHRFEMISIALDRLKSGGVIICDNAEGYGFYEGFKYSGFSRVDFFGNAPGVVLPHCTSIHFYQSAALFDAKHMIPVIAKL